MHHCRCYHVACVLQSKVKNMYKELNTHDVAHELSSNEDNGFSYNGAYAIAEYLEQFEEDTGEKIELDTVAIRCEYSEYPNANEAAGQYDFVADSAADEDENEASALAYLEERTTVIPFDGGVIIADF